MNSIYKQDKAIKEYAEAAYSVPDLTDEETRELTRSAQCGDKEACDKLFLSHMKYVFNLLSYFYNLENQKQDIEDLIQEGMLGLKEAIDHYRVTDETKFCTYASYWIRKMISAKIMENSNHNVKRPEKKIRKTASVISVVTDYEMCYGKKPDAETIAALTGESVKSIKEVLSDKTLNMTSLDEPALTGCYGNEELSIWDVIADEDTMSVEDSVIIKVSNEELQEALFEIFTDKLDRDIIKCILEPGNENISHKKIAVEIGCSRQNITKRIKRIRQVLIKMGIYPD